MAITYSLKRAAEECGLSIRSLQYAIARGELESFLIGRRRLIRVRSLQEFLRRKTQPVTARESKRGE